MQNLNTPIPTTPASGNSQICRRAVLTGAAGVLAASAIMAEAGEPTDNFETISALLKQYRLANAQRDALCDHLKELDKEMSARASISLRSHVADANDYELGLNGDYKFKDAMSIDAYFGPMIVNAQCGDGRRAKARLARLSGDWERMRRALADSKKAEQIYRQETGYDRLEDNYEQMSDQLFAVEQQLEKIPCLSWRDVRLKLEMIIVDYSWCEQKDWINLHRCLIASMAPDLAAVAAQA
jgi:hypothetical protein